MALARYFLFREHPVLFFPYLFLSWIDPPPAFPAWSLPPQFWIGAARRPSQPIWRASGLEQLIFNPVYFGPPT